MDISIIIVNWNVKDQIRECLASLASIQAPEIEVIVVDNASQDGSVEMIREEFPWVTLIANQDNRGFAQGCNQGIRVTNGEFVLLLNPDTVVPDGALNDILLFAKQHPEAGVIGPKILNPDGTSQPSVRRFPTFSDQTMIQLKLHHIFKNSAAIHRYLMSDFNYDLESSVDQVMGAAFLIPRSVISELGGLDERYFIWYEEVDFCRKVKRAGREVLFCPSASIIHKQGQSFFQLVSSRRQKMMNASLRKYFFKNHGVAQGLWFTALHPVSMGLAYLSQALRVRPKAL